MRRLSNEEGAGLVEYALLITLIIVVALVAVSFTGQETTSMWDDISSGIRP